MIDPLTAYARRLPLRRIRTERLAYGTRTYRPDVQETYDTDQPWVVYTYGRTHDCFWPPWRSSRVLGRGAVGIECAVCGVRDVIVMRMPRFAAIADRGKHPDRLRFLLAHVHPDRPHQMAWARPMLNAFATGPLDLDLLAMRLQADLAELERTDDTEAA